MTRSSTPHLASKSEQPLASVPLSRHAEIMLTLDLDKDYLKFEGDYYLRNQFNYWNSINTVITNISNVTWSIPKPSKDDIIELFAAEGRNPKKTAFYTYHQKLFPKALTYDSMKLWLEKDIDAPLDAELWGDLTKSNYHFTDLKTWLVHQEASTTTTTTLPTIQDEKKKKKKSKSSK